MSLGVNLCQPVTRHFPSFRLIDGEVSSLAFVLYHGFHRNGHASIRTLKHSVVEEMQFHYFRHSNVFCFNFTFLLYDLAKCTQSRVS